VAGKSKPGRQSKTGPNPNLCPIRRQNRTLFEVPLSQCSAPRETAGPTRYLNGRRVLASLEWEQRRSYGNGKRRSAHPRSGRECVDFDRRRCVSSLLASRRVRPSRRSNTWMRATAFITFCAVPPPPRGGARWPLETDCVPALGLPVSSNAE
jgi:hypothetical protein